MLSLSFQEKLVLSFRKVLPEEERKLLQIVLLILDTVSYKKQWHSAVQLRRTGEKQDSKHISENILGRIYAV